MHKIVSMTVMLANNYGKGKDYNDNDDVKHNNHNHNNRTIELHR